MELSRTVDFISAVGRVKPMHAVNNGPRQGPTQSWDITAAYVAMNIPYSRLHDTEYPYGGGQFVDIHCVFPDFGADETLPESYNFVPTDRYIAGIIEAGGQPFYRLGESIDHTPNPLYIYPPKDYDKWARVCEHIVAHYNEGWANGFRYAIKYWEIWNEPEGDAEHVNQKMWIGAWDEYIKLYAVAARRLKARFGESIKVGGYAAIFMDDLLRPGESGQWALYLRRCADEFMAYITSEETKAPLDFFSYHKYNNDPKFYFAYNNAVRKWLDGYGFKDAEIILNEWNIDPNLSYNERLTLDPAARVAYILCSAQKSAVDMMMYYDLRRGTIYNGLISIDRQPFAPFHSFVMFGKLYALGTEVFSGEHESDPDVAICAATDGKRGGIMVANPTNERKILTLKISGAERFKKMRVYSMDRLNSPFLPLPSRDMPASETLALDLRYGQSINYIEFE